jgi:pimeloyl-ACP methyl ester carboxylesterase
MVKAYQGGGLPNPPLKWWQTINTALPKSPGAPASPELFYGASGDGVQISPVGLAYALTQADPNAVVLAYSWIDDSATSELAGGIPEGAYLSEAYTVMNGARLANALTQALPTDFSSGGGKLHLIGHSHGSKVATVAANVLAQRGDANFAVQHLSILDSPEAGSDLVSLGDAANHLWYYLGALNIGRSPTTTFVDNYISEFDNPLGTIQGVNPFNTSQTTSVVQQLVDVNLNPSVLFGPEDFGSRHGYAFNWYGGGSLAWAQNPTPTVANRWSPLINPGMPATLAGSYTQSWTAAAQNQFELTPTGTPPNFNTVQTTPEFTDLAFTSTSTSGGATFNNGVVTLSQSGTNPSIFTGGFSPLSKIAGISFNFRFTNVGAGDQLVISVGTGFAHAQQIHFVMTGTVAGTTERFATLSLGSLAHSIFNNSIEIKLVPVANSGASVQILNMQQFVI